MDDSGAMGANAAEREDGSLASWSGCSPQEEDTHLPSFCSHALVAILSKAEWHQQEG